MDIPIEIILHISKSGDVSVLSIAFEKKAFKIRETTQVDSRAIYRQYYNLLSSDKKKRFIVYFNKRKNLWYLYDEKDI